MKIEDRHVAILETLADHPVKTAWPGRGQGVLASYLVRQGLAEYYDVGRVILGTRITPAGLAALAMAKGKG